VTDYAVLYEGDPHTLFWTNSSTNSNIGIGNGGNFTGSGSGTIGGEVRFAPLPPSASCPPCLVYMPDGITVVGNNGDPVNNVAAVTTNLTALTMLSQNLADIPVDPAHTITIQDNSDSPPLDVTTGQMFGNNQYLFRGFIAKGSEFPSSTFPAGATFTISGTADQFVIFDIPSTRGVGFDGSVMLEGGITPDRVLFNFDAGPLLIDTGGRVTMGTFLDPSGIFNINNTILNGRIFGGDAGDSSIIGSTIDAPPFFQTPEPTSLVLLGVGLLLTGIVRRRGRNQNQE
jgi:hypothetical protein